MTVATVALGTQACGGDIAQPHETTYNPPRASEARETTERTEKTDSVDPTYNPPPPKPEPESCPVAEPRTGNPCNVDSSETCSYNDCMGHRSIIASCDDGAWNVTASSCNPPPPVESCPVEQPVAGTFCSVAPSETCGYKDCMGSPSLFATCKGYSWEVVEQSCNPPPPQP